MANRRRLLQVLAIMTVLAEILSVASLYVPESIVYPMRARQPVMSRRQDSGDDDDEMDSNASAPYQNQEDSSNNSGGQQDGYEENEPDGPYGETPREEEGQADLERFFDDHLGASERDGMDKENLPSNLIEYVSLSPQPSSPSGTAATREPFIYNLPNLPEPLVVNHPMVAQASKSIASYSRKLPTNNVETRYLKLPDDRVIIVHHEERDFTRSNRADDRAANTHVPGEILPPIAREATSGNHRRSDNFGDRIVAAENDDLDKVYVTRAIDKPFKIDALGGYDPEQDFQDAERDLDDHREPSSGSTLSRPKRRRTGGSEREETTSIPPPSRDINFNDGETDTMFNDASEMDEITFAQDDPYQTDLEAEMRSQAFDKPTPAAAASASSAFNEAPEVRIAPNRKRSAGRRQQTDEAEGSWINDGVDEMDIPSQSHQDKVLDRSAKQQEGAATAVAAAFGHEQPDQRHEDESATSELPTDQTDQSADASSAETASDIQEQPAGEDGAQQQQELEEPPSSEGQIDPENQRMPNANYLKNLTDEPEDYETDEGL